VVPALVETLGGSVLDGLAQSALQAGEDGQWLDGLAADAHARLVKTQPAGLAVDRDALVALPGPLRDRVLLFTMRGLAGNAQIRTEHVHEAYAVAVGRQRAAESPAGRWELSGGNLVLLNKTVPVAGTFRRVLTVPGSVAWEGESGVLRAWEAGHSPPREPGELEVLVVPPVHGRFVVRRRKAGDVIRLTAGRKKLQDLFVDAKVPRWQRDNVPVVTDSNDNVVWVPGLGLSEDFRAPAAGGGVILLRFTPMGEQA